jgi:hypothetical protein
VALVSQWPSAATINGEERPAEHDSLATPTERAQALLELVAGRNITVISAKEPKERLGTPRPPLIKK